MKKAQARTRRRRFATAWRATAIAALLMAAGAVMPAGSLLAAPAAYAGSGDFCVKYDLNKYEDCNGVESHSSYVELESWNSDKKGLGSCVAVEGGGKACSESTFTEIYDEIYCRGSCNGDSGHPYVQDYSPYNSLFTGWADWR